MTDEQNANQLVDIASSALTGIGLACKLKHEDMYLVIMTVAGMFIENLVKPEHREFMLNQLMKDIKEGIDDVTKMKAEANYVRGNPSRN